MYKDIIRKGNFYIDDDNINMMIIKHKECSEACKQHKITFYSLTIKQIKGLQLKMCRKHTPSEYSQDLLNL